MTAITILTVFGLVCLAASWHADGRGFPMTSDAFGVVALAFMFFALGTATVRYPQGVTVVAFVALGALIAGCALVCLVQMWRSRNN